jgi:glycosyltransferase involved in cell wall biosynthesis
MSTSRCCICGTVKNCAPYLERVLHNMERVGSLFVDYVLLIAYDISHDDSLGILQRYQASHPGRMHILINTDPLSPVRTANLAKARNRCLQTIRESPVYASWEYFVMMDCDDVCATPLHLRTLATKLLRRDWDALTFHRHPYYDLWALSIGPYQGHYGLFPGGHRKWYKYVTQQLRATPWKELVPCRSAFNGFAIYRAPLFLDCVYDGKLYLERIPACTHRAAGPLRRDLTAERGDCEHRAFHEEAIRKHGARIRISPQVLFPSAQASVSQGRGFGDKKTHGLAFLT